jgi:hypothetical protein
MVRTEKGGRKTRRGLWVYIVNAKDFGYQKVKAGSGRQAPFQHMRAAAEDPGAIKSEVKWTKGEVSEGETDQGRVHTVGVARRE